MIPEPDDMWDPNTWDLSPRECRVYASNADEFCVVDEIDYQWAIQRRWHINEPHPTRNGQKRYFRSRAGWREGKAEYLHVGVMKRTGIEPPSELHTLVDHLDGQEFNCRRKNLEWATPKMNRETSRAK